MTDLYEKRCLACEAGVRPLGKEESQILLSELHEWTLNEAGTLLSKTMSFKNYYHTMAFVNAVAFIAHTENHHPDLEVHYNACRIVYQTHAIKGLSENDFICAAKIDRLLKR